MAVVLVLDMTEAATLLVGMDLSELKRPPFWSPPPPPSDHAD